ncbi:MAG: SH3 domain-containing protein [Chitinophagaceae bacterium]|nr:SH3 domain-containing protein [Chitinophagaceae bacterium]
MRKILLLSFIILSFDCLAQPFGAFYVSARTGLSIREKPDAASKVLEKIPYGTKITTLDDGGEWKDIVTEGMTGYWRKVTFNNKTGYIVDSYLSPWAPPKLATIKDMKQYLGQVSLPAGAKVVTRSGTMTQITESGWELTKQLYKNGAEYHQFYAYEYSADTYFLPGYSIQQGFVLCRLIPEFKDIFGEKDEFPLTSKKFTKDGKEYEIKVHRPMGDGADSGDTSPFSIEKIEISFEDGAYYQFEMYMLENQLVIFFSAGV